MVCYTHDMSTESNPTTVPVPNRFREDEIIAEACKDARVSEFPSIAGYSDFTPVQRYIALLAQQIRSAEAVVEEAAAHVASNAASALRSGNSLGVIQGSGPLLDVYVATLVERRNGLRSALRNLPLS